MSDDEFRDSVAIITGGAKGLGRTISERLARRGSKVVIADIDTEAAQALQAELTLRGHFAVATSLDVTRTVEVERVVSDVVNQFGKVDYFVNNAGLLGPIAPLWETNDAELAKMLLINVLGVFACTRAVAKTMMSRRGRSLPSRPPQERRDRLGCLHTRQAKERSLRQPSHGPRNWFHTESALIVCRQRSLREAA